MAKESTAAERNPSVLPVPELVLKHHEESLLKSMQEWLRQKQVPPVLLLTGMSGIGKRAIAFHLSQWMSCERVGFHSGAQPESDDGMGGLDLFGGGAPAIADAATTPERPALMRPCGECTSCLRALHGNWVDFTEVRSEGDRETLKIDQFRDLKTSMGFGAHEGAFRITLIADADRMTLQAANSMLKLLEEPPRGWVFLLTASDPTLLLPTIVSRCQSLKLRPLGEKVLELLLVQSGATADRASVVGRLAQGSWGQALRLCDEETWKLRQTVFGFVQDPSGTSSAWVPACVDAAAAEPRRLDLLIDQLEHASGELLKWSLSGMEPEAYGWESLDGRSALIKHARATVKKRGSLARAREFWIDRSTHLARSRAEVLTPVNRKILIQDLLLPWMQ